MRGFIFVYAGWKPAPQEELISGDVPVGGGAFAGGALEDVDAGGVVELVFPEAGDDVLDDFVEEGFAVVVGGVLGELLAGPFAEEGHGVVAAELPLFALDGDVGRGSD